MELESRENFASPAQYTPQFVARQPCTVASIHAALRMSRPGGSTLLEESAKKRKSSIFSFLRHLSFFFSPSYSHQPLARTHLLHDVNVSFKSVRAELMADHPVEAMQKKFVALQEEQNLAVAGNVMGRSLPMQLIQERAAFAEIRRLPTLPSSMIALEIALGRETSLDFQDYMNDPMEAHTFGPVHQMVQANPAGFRGL